MAFDAFGMAGGGDEGFAFLSDDTSSMSTSMVRMAGNMASIHDGSAMTAPAQRGTAMPGVGAAAPAAAGPPISAKAKAMDDRLEALRAARDRDLPGPPGRR